MSILEMFEQLGRELTRFLASASAQDRVSAMRRAYRHKTRNRW